MAKDCSIPCGGRCCRSFPLSLSPQRIGEQYAEAKAYLDNDPGEPDDRYCNDMVTIGEMVIRVDQEDDEDGARGCAANIHTIALAIPADASIRIS
jgi:hypothetical protein